MTSEEEYRLGGPGLSRIACYPLLSELFDLP